MTRLNLDGISLGVGPPEHACLAGLGSRHILEVREKELLALLIEPRQARSWIEAIDTYLKRATSRALNRSIRITARSPIGLTSDSRGISKSR
jgi:hypothetical protein